MSNRSYSSDTACVSPGRFPGSHGSPESSSWWQRHTATAQAGGSGRRTIRDGDADSPPNRAAVLMRTRRTEENGSAAAGLTTGQPIDTGLQRCQIVSMNNAAMRLR
jgi:hypothetical protein